MDTTSAFGSDACYYPPPLLIFSSVVSVPLQLACMCLCKLEGTFSRHLIFFNLCLTFLCAQFILAIKNIDASGLFVTANNITTFLTLFNNWCSAMKKRTSIKDRFTSYIIDTGYIMNWWQLLLIPPFVGTIHQSFYIIFFVYIHH
jgi:hypothetical protein